MENYCPCLGKVSGAELAGGTGVPAGGAGGAEFEMWPSMGESAEARLMTPITTRIIGHDWPKENPLRVCSRRNSTPTVMTTAGPIKLRMVQRRH
jgi:hypothetical protein